MIKSKGTFFGFLISKDVRDNSTTLYCGCTHCLLSVFAAFQRTGDGARTNKRSVSVFVRAKGKSRRCAATEAPTDVAFVAAADLSSDEFLKGIYNVATSPSRLVYSLPGLSL